MDILHDFCENVPNLYRWGMLLHRILVLHGPNLNLLGMREQAIYGTQTLEQLNDTLMTQGLQSGVEVWCKQSNAEHELIGLIQQAMHDDVRFIIINAAGFTHTSIALRDALLATQIPFIEVHISNTYSREEFRIRSYLADIARGIIIGLGPIGYELALSAAIRFLNNIK